MPRNRGIPHYRRIADHLIGKLAATGKAGGKVPSEHALARQFGVARNTARRALEELRRQGHVQRFRGTGTYSTGQSTRLVVAFGYLVQHYQRLFSVLGHQLANAGLRLVVRETGYHGELLAENFQPAEVRRAEAVLWYAPSHVDGLHAARIVRRKLPKRLPLVLLDDTLGLSLQSRQPLDLVHFDGAETARQLVARLARDGIQHPVLLRRPDLTIFAAHATQVGFEAALVESGVTDVAAHVVEDDATDPTALRQLFAPDAGRGWQPQALVLHYLYEADLRARCLRAKIPLPPELPVIAMGQTEGAYRLRVDQRALAAVCANLILSRLQDPQRPNLHVTLSLPVQGKTSR